MLAVILGTTDPTLLRVCSEQMRQNVWAVLLGWTATTDLQNCSLQMRNYAQAVFAAHQVARSDALAPLALLHICNSVQPVLLDR